MSEVVLYVDALTTRLWAPTLFSIFLLHSVNIVNTNAIDISKK